MKVKIQTNENQMFEIPESNTLVETKEVIETIKDSSQLTDSELQLLLLWFDFNKSIIAIDCSGHNRINYL